MIHEHQILYEHLSVLLTSTEIEYDLDVASFDTFKLCSIEALGLTCLGDLEILIHQDIIIVVLLTDLDFETTMRLCRGDDA
jgi:hypothetical protein